jgi:hypothetical protein
MLVDREGERIGKLQDVYVDVENDEPQFATGGRRRSRKSPQARNQVLAASLQIAARAAFRAS